MDSEEIKINSKKLKLKQCNLVIPNWENMHIRKSLLDLYATWYQLYIEGDSLSIFNCFYVFQANLCGSWF